MAITKPPVLPSWAEAGDKVQPSNAEIQVGWPLSSIPPSRQRFNWLLNFLANGIRYFSRRGLPDYDAAETYMIGDRIIGDDGKTYRSLIDNNTGQTPSAQPTKWEEWAPSLSRLADLLQKQTYTAFTTAGAAPNFTLTPTPAITAYTPGQRFRVKFHAAGSGADVLNVSGQGNKSLKQYDSSGAKVAAVFAANQLTDVEYDGVDMIIIDQLPTAPGISQQAADARYIGIGYMLVRDERSSGTTGGASAVGNQTRVLNTVVANTISGASLTSNRIILPAGTYRIRARAPAIGVNNTQTFLYNVTDAAVITRGSSENGTANNVSDPMTVNSFVDARVTLAAAKEIELRQYCNEVHANGLGAPVSQGAEVYSTVEIIKES